jgi:hypothetical protein
MLPFYLDESALCGASGCEEGGSAERNGVTGGEVGQARLGGAFAPTIPALGGGQLEKKAAMQAAIHRCNYQNKIPMIRISFNTRTDSEDPKRPEAWRPEAATVLCSIAKRISAGEAMPLMLFDCRGNLIGKARELSYRPEPPRQSAAKPPHGL